jgi:hypothetical protein
MDRPDEFVAEVARLLGVDPSRVRVRGDGNYDLLPADAAELEQTRRRHELWTAHFRAMAEAYRALPAAEREAFEAERRRVAEEAARREAAREARRLTPEKLAVVSHVAAARLHGRATREDERRERRVLAALSAEERRRVLAMFVPRARPGGRPARSIRPRAREHRPRRNVRTTPAPRRGPPDDDGESDPPDPGRRWRGFLAASRAMYEHERRRAARAVA